MSKDFQRIISVDFDGTLCRSHFPDLGEPNKEIIEEVLYEKSQGSLIVLNTMREGDSLERAVEWCRKQGIEFDAVNDNCSFMKHLFNNNPRKIAATEYWDDLNVSLEEIKERVKNRHEREQVTYSELEGQIVFDNYFE